MLKRMQFTNWNQFQKVDINFHDRATIITGANGAGKSTLIRILSRTIGWDYTEIAKPRSLAYKMNKSSGYLVGLHVDAIKDVIKELTEEKEMETEKEEEFWIDFGNLFTTDKKYKIQAPKESDEASYYITVEPLEEYFDVPDPEGINIPSHRLPYFYNRVDFIPARLGTKNEIYNDYKHELIKRQVPGYYYESRDNPYNNLKSSLIAAAIYGEGNDYTVRNDHLRNMFRELIELLKIMLPETLQFQSLKVENGDMILVTGTGDFFLDAVSSGIGSIIELTWQIYMSLPEEKTTNESNFFVLIDEIENHLHPSMQRSILPNLLKAFPDIQFIVTTHSPFVVNSVEDSTVYALDYNDQKRIYSYQLDFKNKYTSAMEVLRNVLGVPVTMPIWAEKALDRIVNKYSTGGLNEATYKNFREEMKNLGLGELMPDTLKMINERMNADD